MGEGWSFLQQTREYEGVRCDALGISAAMMASHSCSEARWVNDTNEMT